MSNALSEPRSGATYRVPGRSSNLARAALGLGAILAAGCGDGGAPAHSASATATATATASVAATTTPTSSAAPSGSSSVAAPSGSASATPSAVASDDPLSGEALVRDVTYLASPELRGRGSGTEDEVKASKWLVEQLDKAAVGVLEGKRVQPFKFKFYGDSVERDSANVLGLIEPSDPTAAAEKAYLVLGAHYDHLGERRGQIHLGAEDNASGTAVVLGVVRALQKRRAELGRPVVVAFFGAEEAGLKGSAHFVKVWDAKAHPFKAMINVDMIGRSLVDQSGAWFAARMMGIDIDPLTSVGALIPEPAPAGFEEAIRKACKTSRDLRVVTIADLPEQVRDDVRKMARGRGDHAPFEEKKVPFVFFSSGESDDYHKPSDTPEKIEPDIIEQRARGILETVIALSK